MLSSSTETGQSVLPELEQAEALANDLKKLLVRSEHELVKGDARENVERLERWVESYRRGLSAAQKISENGTDMLTRTRNQLKLSLDELLRLEDEGGNPVSKEQANQVENLANAIRRIDTLLPEVEKTFQSSGAPTSDIAVE